MPTVGGYRLLRHIGEGGMGVVHLAEAPDGHRAALKVLRPNVVGDEESRRRLAQEVESLRHVRSSHVAEVLDADPWGEVPYVVTRFVPGQSLHEAVAQQGPLQGDDLEGVAVGLLLAVQDVHLAGVLHRDIKPTNVVLDDWSPVLIDFGLARLAEDPGLTATGWLMGTPGYLAPEVLLGGQASTATDVHGWAATLVYAATGRPPYGQGHVMTILDRTRHGQVDLTGVPQRLRPLLTASLATDPRDRPTVHEALTELDAPAPAAAPSTRPYTVVRPPQQPQVGRGVPVRPMPWQDRLSGWGRFRRLLALLTLAAVVVVGFVTAPYVTAALVAALVLLARGASHSRDATWQRRAVRGRRWFDGPLAVTVYPWHLVRGALGACALLLASGLVTAGVVAALALTGRSPSEALVAGGAALVLATWLGPGASRVREAVGRGAAATARHASVWWLVMAAVAVLGAMWWWTGSGSGVVWDPASGSPWESLRELARHTGLSTDRLGTRG